MRGDICQAQLYPKLVPVVAFSSPPGSLGRSLEKGGSDLKVFFLGCYRGWRQRLLEPRTSRGDLSHLTTLVLPFCSQRAECEDSSQLDQDGKVCASQLLVLGAKTKITEF